MCTYRQMDNIVTQAFTSSLLGSIEKAQLFTLMNLQLQWSPSDPVTHEPLQVLDQNKTAVLNF